MRQKQRKISLKMLTYSTYLSVRASSSYIPSKACFEPPFFLVLPKTLFTVSSSISSPSNSEYFTVFIFVTLSSPYLTFDMF